MTKLETGFGTHTDQIKKPNEEQINIENINNIVNQDRRDIEHLQTEMKSTMLSLQTNTTQIANQTNDYASHKSAYNSTQLVVERMGALTQANQSELEKLRTEARTLNTIVATLREKVAALEATVKSKE